jgi:DNA-binding MarR family transcriptional regulator
MVSCSIIERMTPPPPEPVDESELALMREIAREPIRTQRDLSRSAGLSLGMTNLLLKRLARKGLIKVLQLDWKRTQYLLTPKGALEKTRKTYEYARYTLRLFRQLQENVAAALRTEHARGRRRFWIVAQDEFQAALGEAVPALGLPGADVAIVPSFAALPPEADLVFVAAQEDAPARPGLTVVNLVDFLDVRFRLPAS